MIVSWSGFMSIVPAPHPHHQLCPHIGIACRQTRVNGVVVVVDERRAVID